MGDTPIEISDSIPIGSGAKGMRVYKLPPEILTYTKQKGSGISAYPLTIFCPKCSHTHEFNYKTHSWRQRWLIEETDYHFNIEYATDDNEDSIYAVCSKCGFDLRKDYIQDNTIKKIVKNDDAQNYVLSDIQYQDGHFLIPLSEFKKAVRHGYRWKGDIIAHKGNNSYRLRWENYSNSSNFKSENGIVYFKKSLWKQA